MTDEDKHIKEMDDALGKLALAPSKQPDPFKPRVDANTRPTIAPAVERPWVDRVPVQPPTLTEQWDVIQRHDREFRDRLRKEQSKLVADHDTQWLALRHKYEQRISDTIADMQAELADEQRRVTDAYHQRKRELDLLLARVEDEQ